MKDIANGVGAACEETFPGSSPPLRQLPVKQIKIRTLWHYRAAVEAAQRLADAPEGTAQFRRRQELTAAMHDMNHIIWQTRIESRSRIFSYSGFSSKQKQKPRVRTGRIAFVAGFRRSVAEFRRRFGKAE